jgi:DNA-binding NarL/FixJ family response regulator
MKSALAKLVQARWSPRVALVARGALSRQGLETVLLELLGDSFLSVFSMLPELKKLAPELTPQVLLACFCTDESWAAGVVRQLRINWPMAPVFVLVASAEPVVLLAAFDEGARGFATTSCRDTDLELGIRALHAGALFASADVLSSFIGSGVIGGALSPMLPHLTAREQTIAHFVLRGYRDKEIADRLGLKTRTVSNHVHHILVKGGIQSRYQLAGGWAVDHASPCD